MKMTSETSLSLRPKLKTGAPWIALLGAPNSGKTALFNRLTGLHHKVGNYPGITVEKKSGKIRGSDFILHDLPGAYSLDAKSIDEQIVADQVKSWQQPDQRPRAVLIVLDAVHLSRSLYLALQIIEWGLPTIIVLNMIDDARQQNIVIDTEKLRRRLGVFAVVAASAKTGEGLATLLNSIKKIGQTNSQKPASALLTPTTAAETAIAPLVRFVEKSNGSTRAALVNTIDILANKETLLQFKKNLSVDRSVEFHALLQQCRGRLNELKIDPASLESQSRYAFIDLLLDQVTSQTTLEHKSFSERLDTFLLHPLWGGLSLLLILGLIFDAIFSWAQAPMSWIESGVAFMADGVNSLLPAGPLNSLLSDGVIPGVGNVVVFLPQIMLLIFFLGVLEDSGYLSRMAFFLDRSLRRFGLHGKSVLPMLSGFACAIPAIMSARTIESRRDRLLTIMLIPLMSCSARLPVYTLLIAAFVPQKLIFGFLQLQGLVMLGAYGLGFITALLVSAATNRLSNKRRKPNFIMELPPYRMPLPRSLFFKVYDASKLFLVNAGGIILALSIVLWFLASYPKSETSAHTPVETTFAGQLGRAVEPIIKPLGFDWKIGIGLLTSFAAREVIVSSFATIYNLQDEEENVSLIEALKNDRKPDGSPTYPPLVGVALLVFFVFAAQCMSTFAIIKRETNSWRWPMVMLIYMNVLAYSAAFLVYQGGRLLGMG